MQIKADGVTHIYVKNCLDYDEINYYRAWFIPEPNPNDEYSTSLLSFKSEEEAVEYGKRVAERYNRIFGKETKDDNSL